MSIFGVFRRVEIDDSSCIISQHGVLEKRHRRRDSDRDCRVQKNKQKSGQREESCDGSGNVNHLNSTNIGAQPWNDAEHTDGKLKTKSNQNDEDQERGV